MATSKVQLKKEQQALKTLGFRNINHFVKNMKTPDKIKKRNEITPLTSTNLGLGLNDENSRIRERSESESPKLHEKKKTKKSTETDDYCSDSDIEEMDTNTNLQNKTDNTKQYRKNNQKPLREGEILIKIVNNSPDSPISACKPGSVSLIKTTLHSIGLAEIPDMGQIQINSKDKWATMTLIGTGPGLKTETTIKKLEKGPLDLSKIDGNTQALWTITKLNKTSTGLIKNIDNNENIHELESYLIAANPEVKSIRRLGKSWNVAVQFNSSDQPLYLDTPFGRRKVNEYVRSSPQCMKCFKFGHTTSRCDLQEDRCAQCGEEGHKIETCTNSQKCALCGSDSHNVWSRDCPKKQEMREKKDDEIEKARSWQQKQSQKNKNENNFHYNPSDFPDMSRDSRTNTHESGQHKTTNAPSAPIDLMKSMVDEVKLDLTTQIEMLQSTISTLIQTVNTCMETIKTTIGSLGKTCQEALTRNDKTNDDTNSTLQRSVDKIAKDLHLLSERVRLPALKPFGSPSTTKHNNSYKPPV